MNPRDLRNITLGAVIGSVSLYAVAAVSVPNTFAPGTLIKAEEVNANFLSLKSAVEALEASGSVSAARLADGAVTTAKLGTQNQAGTGKFLAFNGSGLVWADTASGSVGPQGPVGSKGDPGAVTFASNLSGSATNAGLTLHNTGSGAGLSATSNSATFGIPGVFGENNSTTGQSVGVVGQATSSPIGTGVRGSGAVTGGYFEATGTPSGALTPTGVYGVAGNDGIGVKAQGGTALELDGALRVTGNARTAFRVLAAGGLDDLTTINNAFANNDPSALVSFTPIGGLGLFTATLGYDGAQSRWVIRCKASASASSCPNGYNVLVIKQ